LHEVRELAENRMAEYNEERLRISPGDFTPWEYRVKHEGLKNSYFYVSLVFCGANLGGRRLMKHGLHGCGARGARGSSRRVAWEIRQALDLHALRGGLCADIGNQRPRYPGISLTTGASP